MIKYMTDKAQIGPNPIRSVYSPDGRVNPSEIGYCPNSLL